MPPLLLETTALSLRWRSDQPIRSRSASRAAVGDGKMEHEAARKYRERREEGFMGASMRGEIKISK